MLPEAAQLLDTDVLDTCISIFFKDKLISESVPKGHILQTELWALKRALEMLRDKIQPSINLESG